MNRKAQVVLSLTVVAEVDPDDATQDIEAIRLAALEQLDDTLLDVQDEARPASSSYKLIVLTAEPADRSTASKARARLAELRGTAAAPRK